jgi:hypothetical protein
MRIAKIYIKSILPALALLIISSCEKIIDMRESQTSQIIAVNSIICPDSVFKVHLSHSVPVLYDSVNNILTDKVVEVYEDNVLVRSLKHKSGGYYYDLSFYPRQGKIYRIRILDGSVQVAEASTSIPIPIPVISLLTDESIKQWGKALIIYVLFDDPANQDNYYRISLRERARFAVKDENDMVQYKTYIRYKWIDYEASTILKGMGEVPEDQVVNHHSSNDYNIFADDVINGKEYSLSVYTDYYEEKFLIDSQISVLFQSISPEYYDYLKSRTLYNDVKNNPFAEPIRVYSNITNGIGIFGGFSYSKRNINYVNGHITIP